MSVRVIRAIDCEGHALRPDILMCGESVEGIPGETADDIRRQAREDGWTRSGGRDICPDCRAALAAAKGGAR